MTPTSKTIVTMTVALCCAGLLTLLLVAGHGSSVRESPRIELDEPTLEQPCRGPRMALRDSSRAAQLRRALRTRTPEAHGAQAPVHTARVGEAGPGSGFAADAGRAPR